MMREKILNFINETIIEEHGKEVYENNLLTDCSIDSFGYAILFTSIEAEYSIKYKDIRGLDYSVFTVCDLIDNIIKYIEENNVCK